MKGSTLAFLLEFGLVFGSALGLAFWQLYSLRKLRLKREEKERNERGDH